MGNSTQNAPTVGAGSGHSARNCSAPSHREARPDSIRGLIGEEFEGALAEAERLTGLTPADILKVGLRHTLAELKANRNVSSPETVKTAIQDAVEANGFEWPEPVEGEPLMTLSEFLQWQRRHDNLREIIRRFVEVDQALEVKPGHGIAESILGGILEDIEMGVYDLITEGWDFDGGADWAAKKLAGLAAKWREAA